MAKTINKQAAKIEAILSVDFKAFMKQEDWKKKKSF